MFIGLMSGTSLDGVDGVLCDPAAAAPPLAHVHACFDDALRDELLRLNGPAGGDELHRASMAANAVAEAYAGVVDMLLTRSGVASATVRAVGAHGQTVRHRPGAFDGQGYTTQLLNGALLAERCGIDVVCDFRSRDVAAGGQGAPLVPAFHAERFGVRGQETAVLNIGGIANLTLIGADGQLRGFDSGPGNVLMDHWIQTHRGRPFDDGGAWAAGEVVDAPLLARVLSDPYFARTPPKSTGRDLFHPDWLQGALADVPPVAPGAVQATLLELTARSAADALRAESPSTRRLSVCGGGARNTRLMARLAALLPGVSVDSTQALGVPPDQVEALAFAWLAMAFVERRPGSVPAVTGARGARVLGALYPA